MAASDPSLRILVINSGSSSLKFALLEPNSGHETLRGLGECLGTDDAVLHVESGQDKRDVPLDGNDHAAVLQTLPALLENVKPDAIGHRVVHGGEAFSEPALIDDSVLDAIEQCVPLAPLHNPANLLGIRAAMTAFPGIPQTAVFDTAFHQTLPPHAFHYAIPHRLYEKHRIRRYGFHGTSHAYVAMEAAQRLERPLDSLRLLTAHLGNGCSACAIDGGRSVDTTMGLTPLEGLVMGTRSGDVDPNLHAFLKQSEGMSLESVDTMLNKESGLLGVSALSSDMRTLTEAADKGHEQANLAIDLFCYRLAKALLGLCAGLSGLDSLVFTGGIGEHAPAIRARTIEHLALLQLSLDPVANDDHGRQRNGRIDGEGSRAVIQVIPTNEELMIARAATRQLPKST